MNTKPQPVLIAFSILAFLSFVSGGLAALGFDSKIVGLLSLIVGGLNIGAGFYVRGQVVPLANMAAYENDKGVVVAGPAAVAPNGSPVTVVSK